MKYLLKSKKLGIFIVMLAVIIISIGFFIKWNSLRVPSLFAYIPADAEQIMINQPKDSDTTNLASTAGVSQAALQQFQNITMIITTQEASVSGAQMMFVQAKSEFSPQDFLTAINPATEMIYTYQRLADGLYVFAPQANIQSYNKPKAGESFFDQPKLHDYLGFCKSNNLVVISHNNSLIQSQETYASLLQNVQYFIMGVSSTPKKTHFVSDLIFKTPFTGKIAAFVPQFLDYAKDSNLIYLEMGDLISALGIDMGSFLGQDTGADALKSAAQNQFLQMLFAKHLGIVLSKGSNATNLGLTIVSKDPTLYTSLEPLMPTLAAYLQALPYLSGAVLDPVTQEGKVGYDITLQGIQKVGLYLEKTDKETKLSLGNPLFDGKSAKDLLYKKSSLLTLKIDLAQVFAFYKQFADIAGANTALIENQSSFAQWKDKTFFGDVSMETEKMSLEGVIE